LQRLFSYYQKLNNREYEIIEKLAKEQEEREKQKEQEEQEELKIILKL
jgi:hypothetical protein